MNSLCLKEIVCTVEPIVREAGLSALSLQDSSLDIRYKSSKDIVTAADIASEHILIDGLKKAFPTHAIRTEEAGVIANENANKDIQWVIDPVDGTVNFSRGIPFWGVSAGLIVKGEAVIGICFLPRLNEMYIAYKGGGSYLNGNRIHVSEISDLNNAILTNGDFNVEKKEYVNAKNSKNFASEANSCMRVKCYGSAVAEGCLLARGSFDGFIMTTSYPWDIAGISCIITEAGGRATKVNGNALQFTDLEEVVFSNSKLHDKILDILK